MSCKSCSKTFLLLINAIFLVVGFIVLGVGIWVIIDSNVFLQTLAEIPTEDNSGVNAYGKLIDDAAYILIAAGGAVTLISFLGCCGALKINTCLLITYSVLLGLLVLAEIACIILAVGFYQSLEEFLTKNLVPSLTDKYQSDIVPTDVSAGKYAYKTTDALSKGIDAFQIGFRCCGFTGVGDYGGNVSLSCCDVQFKDADDVIKRIYHGDAEIIFSNPSCPTSDQTSLANQNRPCQEALVNYISERSLIFIGIAAGVLGFELLGIIMACSLWCAKRKEGKY